jgi:hypothetical protein
LCALLNGGLEQQCDSFSSVLELANNGPSMGRALNWKLVLDLKQIYNSWGAF